MITEKQFRIFGVFAKRPFAEFTRKQVKNETKEKSNNALALTVNQLKNEEVLIEKKVGKSGLLTLNLNNDLTFHYIALCNRQRTEEKVRTAVRRLKDEIGSITQFHSIVIFGSYADGRHKESSDLDVAVFIDGDEKRKQIEAAINSAKMKTLIEIDAHVIPKAEMIEMLTNDEENLGKQIARKHLAVHNHQIFYDIVKEGVKRGFHA
jgi:predicted nucleotidyltransferase